MKRLRFVFFIPVYKPAYQFGGPIQSTERLCRGLASHGVSVKVLTTDYGQEQVQSVSDSYTIVEDGVEVIYFRSTKQKALIWSWELLARFPTLLDDCDVFHASCVWHPIGYLMVREAHKRKKLIIQATRGALSEYSFNRGRIKKALFYLLFERKTLTRTDLIHVTSELEKSEVKHFGLGKKSIKIPNPIDCDVFSFCTEVREKARRQLGIGEDTTLFIVAGRLHNKKGLDLLPFALSGIKGKKWRILFVGDDSDGTRHRLESDLKSLRIEDNATFMRVVSPLELSELFNAADGLLLPSRHENFGNVVVEAMACGCPVVVSDQTGVAGELGEFGKKEVRIIKRDVHLWTQALNSWMPLSVTEKKDLSRRIRMLFSTDSVSRAALATIKEHLPVEFDA